MTLPALDNLVADAQISRAPNRKVIEVAVGILQNKNGQFLMTTRPVGKAYAGYWEFPGGKLEAGESVLAALRRELREEIGVIIANSNICCEQIVDYPHALVRLNFCLVTDWIGELDMREGQTFKWTNLPTSVSPMLPGAKAILEWLAGH